MPRPHCCATTRPDPLITGGALAAGTAPHASTVLGTLASLGVALFPKCPICWLTYMSALGLSSVLPVPYSPWWEAALLALMTLNLATVWWRGLASGRMAGFHLAAAGAVVIVAMKVGLLSDRPPCRRASHPAVPLPLCGAPDQLCRCCSTSVPDTRTHL
jgi:hypothetical protein